jgi:hypothetical protein
VLSALVETSDLSILTGYQKPGDAPWCLKECVRMFFEEELDLGLSCRSSIEHVTCECLSSKQITIGRDSTASLFTPGTQCAT